MSAPHQHAVAADIIFDGESLHRDAVVLIAGDRIERITARRDLPPSLPLRHAPRGAWLAPGFIDLQVNGGGDLLLNDAPSVQTMRAIAAAHRPFGVTSLLPTLITDEIEKAKAALAALDAAADADPSVIGLHLEGPFLSPKKPGVHDPRYLRRPNENDVAMLTAPHRGVLLVTLAPERAPAGFIQRLTEAGVRVCLGHSMATYAGTRAAMQEGLTGFTHLFNAMRPLESREPGPIAAALESPQTFFGMIVDGVHVDPAMLRLALRGLAAPMLVTDAMPPVGGRRDRFALYGDEIIVRDGRCTRRDGTLAGAALDMATAIRNCVGLLGVSLETALRFASVNPARFLGLDHRLGRIAAGCRADLVAFDPKTLAVHATWVAGASSLTGERAARQAAV